MTPLLLLALIAPSTTPITIHTTTHHQKAVHHMAQGNDHTTSSPGGHPPIYHPPGHGTNSTAMGRVGRDARNPMQLKPHFIASQGPTLTPTEHTQRPKG